MTTSMHNWALGVTIKIIEEWAESFLGDGRYERDDWSGSSWFHLSFGKVTKLGGWSDLSWADLIMSPEMDLLHQTWAGGREERRGGRYQGWQAGRWVGQLGMWERRLMSGRNFNWPLPGRHIGWEAPRPQEANPRKCPHSLLHGINVATSWE